MKVFVYVCSSQELGWLLRYPFAIYEFMNSTAISSFSPKVRFILNKRMTGRQVSWELRAKSLLKPKSVDRILFLSLQICLLHLSAVLGFSLSDFLHEHYTNKYLTSLFSFNYILLDILVSLNLYTPTHFESWISFRIHLIFIFNPYCS